MMVLFLIVFRVTFPEQINITFHNKSIKDQTQSETCVHKTGESYSGGSYSNEQYFYCEYKITNKGSMSFSQCKFENINMQRNDKSYLIRVYRADCAIQQCTFKQIGYMDSMIYITIFGTGTSNFIFISNTVLNCNSGNDNARILRTENNNNNIQNNYIYFDPTITKGQAFYFKYTDGNTFINNTVVNAKCPHGSAIYTSDAGDKSELQITDSVFTNCRGEDGATLYFSKLDHSLVIQNTIFENCKNFYNNNGDMILFVINKDIDLTFRDCKFRYLECDSEKGGGIGLYCHGQNGVLGPANKIYNVKLYFYSTTFENIFHQHSSIGGGAIAIDNNFENKNTEIKVENCMFKNISDTNNGGAIYFNTNNKYITIRDCTFDQTSSNKDGNSVYIANSNEYTITISNSHFYDCGTSPNSYVFNINCNSFDFFDNEIVFTDSSKSCGCIKSNKLYMHNYKRNIFRNAHVGIDESNPQSISDIYITDNIFDGIHGKGEGRCFYINNAKTNIDISNNTIKNCPTGGILIKIEFGSDYKILKFNDFKFIDNSISDDSFNELQICPQIFIKNLVSNDISNEIELIFERCLFQNNFNPKKGGALAYGKNQYNANTKLTFNNCKFSSNKAGQGGSALSLITFQGCQINNCDFISNKLDQENGVIYIETDFDCPATSAKPSSISPNIEINNCNFEDNEGKDAGIVISSSSNAPLSIQNCPFKNCGNSGHVINIQSNVQSTKIQNCAISFTSSTYSGGIFIHSNGKIDILYINFISTSVDSALTIESEEETEQVSITQCLYDSCTGSKNSCFYISYKTSLFVFKDITIRNVKLSGSENYIGSFILNGQSSLTMTNVSFNNVACSSLYGGGTGMSFSGISELVFEKCDFISNEAHQDRSISRPIENADKNPYYNGDGGAIQIGCQEDTSDMKLMFKNCNFKDNKAERHGGAIAVQTIKEVEIFECNLERNLANYNFESSGKLLYENYFHLKKDGRGGAIYLNPAAGCVDSFIANVIINNCQISSNNAYDGYAIYIEGDDPNTDFTIIKNKFIDNYNPNNYDDDLNLINGAVITTEILSITNDTIYPPDNQENHNIFTYSNDKLKVKELSNVDHSGKTQTNTFTASDIFPTEHFSASIIFSYSSSFSNSNVFSESNPFTESNHFPSSSYFTESDSFTKTGHFTGSDSFSKTNHFSKSDSFTNSNQFTESAKFSNSNKFTNSDSFSKTNQFSKSDIFSKTELFTKSDHFSFSKQFSKSKQFSNSNGFSNSNKFTNSDSFSKTDHFSQSNIFSESQNFTQSNHFSNSKEFSKSKEFSNSNKFTNSDSFTKTNQFSKTDSFSKSQNFTQSDHFSNSKQFSKSKEFSNSNKFTNSDSFSKTEHFSQSNIFSESKHFTQSNHFSNSKEFSKSKEFSNTNKFTNSDSFTKTDQFSKTDSFSKSKQFTQSDHFSNSKEFSLSDPFTKSNQFTQTTDFTSSDLFSKSKYFTNSNQFSKSNYFSLSNMFSKSIVFSSSEQFTFSIKFSESNAFSLTGLFSNSEKFTLSLPFDPSDLFSNSNKFSETQFFTNSEKFSSTTKFTESKPFSESKSFSDSNDFSPSKEFSESHKFTNSFKFSETQYFSFSGSFSSSVEFTQSHSFSNSNKFTDSNGFSKSLEFSGTYKFSHSDKFTLTYSFSSSEKFTNSKAFSQSQSFKPSDFFTDSKQFSKSQQFTETDEFSKTQVFSQSQSFTTSDKFTSSVKFSSSKKFSLSAKFSKSNQFSLSHIFSNSEKFTYSNHFSASEDFSPSITPKISDPLCGIWEDGVFNEYYDCDFTFDDNKYVYIHVLSSNFSNYNKYDGNGSSIHLINCGINCNKTVFIDCVASSGCGGAIYIQNSFDISNNATFMDLLFLRCKALYGGAALIHSNSDLFNVSFSRCHFQSNEALRTKPSNNKNTYLFGGSALFMITKQFTIVESTFIHNKGSGGSVKIYNIFEENSNRINLEENENSIKILGCKFEEDENSKGAINLIDEKYGANIDIFDCNFKGNLKKGFHYIDGKLPAKEKLHIKSCFFENDFNNSVNIDLINKSLSINIDSKNRFLHAKFGLIVCIMIFIILLILKIFYINCFKEQYRNSRTLSFDENYEPFKSNNQIQIL